VGPTTLARRDIEGQAVTRYACKFDATHVEITKGLKRIGWWFHDCARYPGLGFDILTKHKDGFPLLLEIKNPGPPSSQKLTESEQGMLEAFPQFFRIVSSLDHTLAAIGLT